MKKKLQLKKEIVSILDRNQMNNLTKGGAGTGINTGTVIIRTQKTDCPTGWTDVCTDNTIACATFACPSKGCISDPCIEQTEVCQIHPRVANPKRISVISQISIAQRMMAAIVQLRKIHVSDNISIKTINRKVPIGTFLFIVYSLKLHNFYSNIHISSFRKDDSATGIGGSSSYVLNFEDRQGNTHRELTV